jgi:uncharacterized protein (TIGR00299 family) protein
MVVGALLDLGLPLDELRRALGSLEIEYGAVAADRVLRAGVSATKFRVEPADSMDGSSQRRDDRRSSRGHQHEGHHHAHAQRAVSGPAVADVHAHHHTLKAIAAAIERSALSREGKDRAIRMFYRLGEVEARIHDVPLERVHLHEVGALDSIIDIVGAVYGLEWLKVDRVLASPLNVGKGTVVCAHGTFPVPAPATAKLLEGVPIYAGPQSAEMVTPTGALLVTEYAQEFVALPPMRVRAIGYGAGERDFIGHPNTLRVLIGDTPDEGTAERNTETVVVLECEIDDMNPQLFGPLMDRLHKAGALDVFYAAVQMKKNRPGTLVSVVARPSDRDALSGLLFAETTTIGVRYREMHRERLAREIRTIETPVGPIRFKVATRDGRVLNASPEFDDCAKAASERGLPIKDVQAIATKAWLDQ